jgi:hypothetical protein
MHTNTHLLLLLLEVPPHLQVLLRSPLLLQQLHLPVAGHLAQQVLLCRLRENVNGNENKRAGEGERESERASERERERQRHTDREKERERECACVWWWWWSWWR